MSISSTSPVVTAPAAAGPALVALTDESRDRARA